MLRSLEFSLAALHCGKYEPSTGLLSRRRSSIVLATTDRRGGNGGTASGGSKLPEKGFFADVDPKAQVYPVRSGLNADLTKRGGRWQSDFVWNTDVKKALDFQDSVRRQAESSTDAKDASTQDGKGFLSLRSKVDLNSMDVDLSAQLKTRKNTAQTREFRAARRARSGGVQATETTSSMQQRQLQQQRASGYPLVPPTRLETRTWDRTGRYSRRLPNIGGIDETNEELAAKMAAERERYEQLKAELQTWAVGMTAFGLAATAIFYGRDIAASYGVGALAGLLYLRLLNRSVDGFAVGGLGAALGQPRLLIPIILTLGYNRYNTMISDQSGLTLQLLPMLVGFFTYKLAAVGRESLALFDELTEGYKQVDEGSDSEQEQGAIAGRNETSTTDTDVRSVDRAFRKKIMMQ